MILLVCAFRAVTREETSSPLIDDGEMLKSVRKCLDDNNIRVLDIELARLGPDEKPEDYIKFLEIGAALGVRLAIPAHLGLLAGCVAGYTAINSNGRAPPVMRNNPDSLVSRPRSLRAVAVMAKR